MAVSEKQLMANRQNALQSTGPRSAIGKGVSSQNAIRHGLRAEKTVLPILLPRRLRPKSGPIFRFKSQSSSVKTGPAYSRLIKIHCWQLNLFYLPNRPRRWSRRSHGPRRWPKILPAPMSCSSSAVTGLSRNEVSIVPSTSSINSSTCAPVARPLTSARPKKNRRPGTQDWP